MILEQYFKVVIRNLWSTLYPLEEQLTPRLICLGLRKTFTVDLLNCLEIGQKIRIRQPSVNLGKYQIDSLLKGKSQFSALLSTFEQLVDRFLDVQIDRTWNFLTTDGWEEPMSIERVRKSLTRRDD